MSIPYTDSKPVLEMNSQFRKEKKKQNTHKLLTGYLYVDHVFFLDCVTPVDVKVSYLTEWLRVKKCRRSITFLNLIVWVA